MGCQPKQGAARHDPLALCTLPPTGLEERLAWIRGEILSHAVSSQRTGDGIAWELEDVPGLETALERLVALERECCAGLAIRHGPGSRPGRRRLELRGVDPDSAVFASLGGADGQARRCGAGRE